MSTSSKMVCSPLCLPKHFPQEVSTTTRRLQKVGCRLLLQGELRSSHCRKRQHCRICREKGLQSLGREMFLRKIAINSATNLSSLSSTAFHKTSKICCKLTRLSINWRYLLRLAGRWYLCRGGGNINMVFQTSVKWTFCFQRLSFICRNLPECITEGHLPAILFPVKERLTSVIFLDCFWTDWGRRRRAPFPLHEGYFAGTSCF